jgi:hypothetical protein
LSSFSRRFKAFQASPRATTAAQTSVRTANCFAGGINVVEPCAKQPSCCSQPANCAEGMPSQLSQHDADGKVEDY